MSILLYVLDNSVSLALSFIGFFAIWWYILGRTAGFRYNKKTSLLILILLWSFRYFGISLFVSSYLAGKYSGNQLFDRMLPLILIFSSWTGIVTIIFLYKGNALKNLFLDLTMEMIYSISYAIGILVLSPGTSPAGLNYKDLTMIRGLILISYCLFISIVIAKKILPLAIKFSKWEPAHPMAIAMAIAVFYIMGTASNITYAISSGKLGLIIFLSALILSLAYLWVSFFHNEKMKAMLVRHELIRHEDSLKKHYQQILIQSSRIGHYNAEITRTIDGLLERAGGEDNNTKEQSQSLVRDYLKRLEAEYNSISVSKYSDNVRLNEILLTLEKEFQNRSIPVQFRFHDLKNAVSIRDYDIESLLSDLADVIFTHYEGPEDKEHNSETAEDLTVLQGGITRGELILSGEYPGREMSRKEISGLRRRYRRMKAGISILKEREKIKIIIGIPA